MSDAAARLAAAIAERYRIEHQLGRGGMATVYLAEDLKHQRRVAIKVLHPELAAAIGAERFLAEIRTTANLQHPHILPLHDSGAAGGFVFYVMPFVEGTSLRQRLQREHQLPVHEAVAIATQVAGALDYAHRRGVVHRDVKPENILLQDDQALVTDFGIALATDTRADARLTETGLSVGTPQYMSPEQALADRDIDARSDLYSLGVTLYETLTGTPPFTGATAGAIIARILTEEPVPPSQRRRDVPTYLDAAIMTAIEKDPQRRFDSAAAMNAALIGAGSAGATGATRATGATSPTRASHGRRLQWALAGVGLAAALAVAGYIAVHARPTAAHAEAIRAITALPFQNFSRDSADAYLADGIPEDILGNLAGVPGLAVRPMPQDRRFRERPDPRSVAGELHVDLILTGSVMRQGDSIRVTVRPYDVRHDVMLPTSTISEASRSVFALEDSLSRSIARRLRHPRRHGPGPVRLASGRRGRIRRGVASRADVRPRSHGPVVRLR
jgi:TolB-like protein/tRNA A-37 threonylcarbamoyl transferase component Bud32